MSPDTKFSSPSLPIYTLREMIPIYFAANRPILIRDGWCAIILTSSIWMKPILVWRNAHSDQRRPRDWTKALQSLSFKNAFFQFLSLLWRDQSVAENLVGHVIFLALGKVCHEYSVVKWGYPASKRSRLPLSTWGSWHADHISYE